MPLLNYTTTVPPSRTATQIMEILAKHGAQQILLDYVDNRTVGLAFAINTELQKEQEPVNVTGSAERAG